MQPCSTCVTETLGEIETLTPLLHKNTDMHFPLGRWRPSVNQPMPPKDMVMKAPFWSHDRYKALQDRVKRPLPKPDVKWSGSFLSYNVRSRQSVMVEGKPEEVCYFLPLLLLARCVELIIFGL